MHNIVKAIACDLFIVIETSTKQDMIEDLERQVMGNTQGGGSQLENERKEKETLIY
jgi:hypothetical protein